MSKINVNIFRELKSSKARFFSITLLLALSVFVFIGLKATTPDIQQTMRNIYNHSNLADAQLENPLGFSDSEIKSLQNDNNVKLIEKSFQTTASTSNEKDVLKIISVPQKMSKLVITKGHLPKRDNEIVLGEQLKQSYSVGQTIKFKNVSSLRSTKYKIVGFATSSTYMKKMT